MYIIVLVTCANRKEAQRIARQLIESRLAACVNIIDKIASLFRWEAKMDSANEILLLIKSRKIKLAKIIKLVKSMHSYQVPEIIAIPIVGGEKKYLRWIDESVRRAP